MVNITFGSNKYINTNGIIVYRTPTGTDKELLKYELRTSDLKPLISVEIRDNVWTLIGKVHKSTSFVHVDSMYKSEEVREGSEVKKLVLKRKKDSRVVFELIVHSPTDIEVNGIFYVEGSVFPIVATRTGLTVGRGGTISRCTFENCGRGVYLT